MNFGLKLWSTNDYYIKSALELFKKKQFDYIELYIVPGSVDSIPDWEELNIPFILHAPHSLSGLNPSIESCEIRNFELIAEIEEYRKVLNPEFIIFHPGIDGTLEETIRQFCEIRNKFPEIHKCLLVENKPALGLNGENCIGSSPHEIAWIIQKIGSGFCLDIGHAICSANSSKSYWHDVISDFLRLDPTMFHLSDSDIHSEKDAHRNFGSGTFELSEILEQIPEDARITIETEKSSKDNLDDFERDVKYLLSKKGYF